MKALKIIAFCTWMIGSAGITDLSGEFQPAAITMAAAGLGVIAITTQSSIRGK
ncbi:hypothetical protein [Eisenbergiella porci]|uniref:hypothetical protein n=1 Tax=Eisenbergiella porci TaxID=2652274 RepID=UPI002A800487|nr:hypothetical protein [Eisenbergiella porci]